MMMSRKLTTYKFENYEKIFFGREGEEERGKKRRQRARGGKKAQFYELIYQNKVPYPPLSATPQQFYL